MVPLALWHGAAADARTIYATTGNGLSVVPIDGATGVAGAPIPMPDAARTVALEPDGRTGWAVLPAQGAIVPFDTAAGTTGAPIAVGGQPLGIAVAPDGATAYVAVFGGGALVPVDLATKTARPPISLASPFGVAISPGGATAYVTGYTTGSVTPVDLASGTAGAPTGAGFAARGIAVTPDGATVYAGRNDGTVVRIDTATAAADSSIVLDGPALGVAVAPGGATVYVTSDDGRVTPIDTATNAVGPSIVVGGLPSAIAISPDGETAYVARQGGDVVAIDLATGIPRPPIVVGGTPYGIAVTPNQGPRAALVATAAPAGAASAFDASGSTDLDGVVARYTWDFGDGTTRTTASPHVTHAYATSGRYTATVTVTDDEGCSTAVVYTGQTVSCNGSDGASARVEVIVPAVPEEPRGPVPAPPTGDTAAPDTPTPPADPVPRPASRPATPVLSGLTLARRCVRPTSAGIVRLGLRMRLASRAPVVVRIERAVGTGALSRCPAPDPTRRFAGRFRSTHSFTARTRPLRASGAVAAARAPVRARTLRLRLRPGLYRITVRAQRSDGRLSAPVRRFVRVLAPRA